jgi:hypothetical protein
VFSLLLADSRMSEAEGLGSFPAENRKTGKKTKKRRMLWHDMIWRKILSGRP